MEAIEVGASGLGLLFLITSSALACNGQLGPSIGCVIAAFICGAVSRGLSSDRSDT